MGRAVLDVAIETCFEAAFDFSRWPHALQCLAESLDASSCVIRSRDPTHPYRNDQRGRTRLSPDSTGHQEFSALWLERVDGAPDPHGHSKKCLRKPAISFTVEDQITTPEERAVMPYYQEIAHPGDREWWAVMSFKVADRSWCLPLYRSARRGRFTPEEGVRFMSIAPELSRAISLSEKVWASSAASTLTTLDAFDCGAVLLDRRGVATRWNSRAEALLGTGLTIRHGRIHAADTASDQRLQTMIRAAAASAWKTSTGSDPAIINQNGSPWLVAETVPMSSIAHDLFDGGDILLFLSDIARCQSPNERLLRQSFCFTPAETRLALRLAAGEDLEAASLSLGISHETTRTHLRSLFGKTGTSRQAELISLLSRFHRRSAG
jgi:DNA-binding CsgD family transcriptional regulator